MTMHEEVDELMARLARAQADCEAWRAAGPRGKYLEAYFLVEALTLQVDEGLKRLSAEAP